MRVRTRLPTWFLAVLVFAAGWMFKPFLPWMVMALWFGLYARKIHEPLTRKLGGRTSLSASITVSLLFVVLVPIGIVVTSIVLDAITLVQQLLKSDETKSMLENLVSSSAGDSGKLDSASGIASALAKQGDRAWSLFQSVAGVAARVVIGMLILVTGMYGVLIEGKAWYAWIEKHTPLEHTHFRRFGDAFMETGRGLWWGVGGAGLLQSIVATIAYVALGVPSALALGALTLMFSVIPAVGTAVVWIPVTAGLALTGQTGHAITMGVIGIGVVSTIDNVARPWLAHRGKLQLPTWITLVAMFGGIEVMGGWGLIMGPLIVRLAKEALVISREARDPATSSPPVETSPSP